MGIEPTTPTMGYVAFTLDKPLRFATAKRLPLGRSDYSTRARTQPESGRGESNPQSSGWEPDVLPLDYARESHEGDDEGEHVALHASLFAWARGRPG